MIRRKWQAAPLTALALAMMSLGVALTVAPPGARASDNYYMYDGRKIELKLSDRHVALHYADSILHEEVGRSARADMAALGFEVAKVVDAGRHVIVRASESAARSALASRTDMAARIATVRPVFFGDGLAEESHMVTFGDRIVIGFQPNVGIDAREELAARYGLTVSRRIVGDSYAMDCSFSDEEKLSTANRIARENPTLVRYAQPEMFLPRKGQLSDALYLGNDPITPLQWHLDNRPENTTRGQGLHDEDTDAPRAWNRVVRGLSSGGDFGQTAAAFNRPLTVAVFDTGVELGHEDWVINNDDPMNWQTGTSKFINCGSGQIPDPRNVSVVDSRQDPCGFPRLGFDYVENDPFPNPFTLSSGDAHGTAVAGLIAAARNNGVGIMGVAPSVKIYPVRILTGSSAVSDAEFARAITETAERQVDIGNHSYGGPLPSEVEEDAFEFAIQSGRLGLGMLNFAASGNDGEPMSSYPALYDAVYSVGGVNDQGNRPSYGSYGFQLDFVGSTYDFPQFTLEPSQVDHDRTGIVTMDQSGSAGYSAPDPFNLVDPLGNYIDDISGTEASDTPFGGTSASCPVVAGAFALVMAQLPSLSAEELVRLVIATADRPTGAESYTSAEFLTGPGEEADIEDVGLSYRGYDGFSNQLGYGRPNALKALTGQYAEAPFRRGDLTQLYRSDFGTDFATLDVMCTLPEMAEEDSQEFLDYLECLKSQSTWEVSGTPLLSFFDLQTGSLEPDGPTFGDPENAPRVIDQEFPKFVLSFPDSFFPPIIDYAPTINLEGGPTITALDEDAFRFRAVLHSNRPTTDTEEADPRYNPRGRYLPNFAYSAKTVVPLPAETEGKRLVLAFRIKHELSFQNVSDPFCSDSNPVGETSPAFEDDHLQVLMDGSLIAMLTGDTADSPTDFLRAPTGFEEVDSQVEGRPPLPVPVWGEPYFPEKSEETQLKFRTYVIEGVKSNGESAEVEFLMVSGCSFIPEFAGDMLDDEVPEIRRDHGGFQLLEVTLYVEDRNALTDERTAVSRLAPEGREPAVTPAYNDVFFPLGNESTVAFTPALGYQNTLDQNEVPVYSKSPVLGMFSVFDGPILDFDASPRTNLLLYTVDGLPVNGRLFLVSDDGVNERRVTSEDTGIVAASFGQNTDTILAATPTELFSLNVDGSNRQYILSTADSGLNGFSSLTGDEEDAWVAFSATNISGQWDLWATHRSVNTPGNLVIPPVRLLDWPTSDERDARYSPDGTRIAFTSNRLAFNDPTPPPANAMPSLYILDNVEGVITRTETAVGQEVFLDRDLRLLGVGESPVYVGARTPSWTPTGEALLFAGMVPGTTMDRVTRGIGEIARVPAPSALSSFPVTPTPPPTVTPTPAPTATPVPTDQVVLQSRSDFDAEGDGWQFFGVPGVFTPPQATTAFSDLRLTATDSTNTYGFFQSPTGFLRLFPFDLSAEPNPAVGELDFRQSAHYLVRAYIRRTTPDAERAPTLRLRVNSRDGQHFADVTRISLGSLGGVPALGDASAVDLLFQPPADIYSLAPNDQSYNVHFDILNFMPEDDPTGGFVMERLDIFRIPLAKVETVANVRTFTLDSEEDRAAWEHYGVPDVFETPNLFETPMSLGISVEGDTTNTYGFWQTLPGALVANPSGAPGKLFIRMRSLLATAQPDFTALPTTLRNRLATLDFTSNGITGVIPISSGNIVPLKDRPQFYYTYLELPAGSSPTDFLASFDVLSFRPDGSTPPPTFWMATYLEDCVIDLIRVRDYPAADTP